MYLDEIKNMALSYSVNLTDIHVMDCKRIGVLNTQLINLFDGEQNASAIVTNDEFAELQNGHFPSSVRSKIAAAILRLLQRSDSGF